MAKENGEAPDERLVELRDAVRLGIQAVAAAVRKQDADLAEDSEETREAKELLRDVLVQAGIAWLEEKWGPHRECPYCHVSSWSVSSPLDDLLAGEGSATVHFVVGCENCGNTVYVNALTAGIMPTANEVEAWAEND